MFNESPDYVIEKDGNKYEFWLYRDKGDDVIKNYWKCKKNGEENEFLADCAPTYSNFGLNLKLKQIINNYIYMEFPVGKGEAAPKSLKTLCSQIIYEYENLMTSPLLNYIKLHQLLSDLMEDDTYIIETVYLPGFEMMRIRIRCGTLESVFHLSNIE